MTTIHYLVLYQPQLDRVPVSVFFIDDNGGTVRGLYFGNAGGGVSEEAYFRMEVSAHGVERFLECDNPDDHAFLRDRARQSGRHPAMALSTADTAAFAELRTFRNTWWTFGEDDEVRMIPRRTKAMLAIEPGLKCARSAHLDLATFEQIRGCWPLGGF